LNDVFSGRGRVLMIVGEAGIGKTRTAQELARIAGESGAQVWWGWCYDAYGSPPYWPWLRPLRQYIRDTDPARVVLEMGPGSPDIAEIVPDIRRELPDIESNQGNEQVSPESARFRLFDSVSSFLKNVSNKQPLVIVLDDLQWADSSSLRLLEFVAREIDSSRIMIVGTCRDTDISLGDPLSRAMGDLIRARSFQRVDLVGLSQSEVQEFIANVSGVSPSSNIINAVYARTEGNPLFLGEIVGQMRPEELESGDALESSIPEGVRDVIGRRLYPLSQACQGALTVASVIGRDFSLELLDELIDEMSMDALLDALDEALQARVIEELPGRTPRFVFTHPLIQETLLDTVQAPRAMRLHMRIAVALGRLGASESETYAAEVANHCAEAESIMGNEMLIRYSLVAGEHALNTYAFDEAESYFRRALESRGNGPTESERADLMYGLGRAKLLRLERYRMREAIGDLSQAFQYYVDQGHIHKAVDVVQFPISPLPGLSTGAADLIARAMGLRGLNPVERGRLLNIYGRVMGIEEGDYETSKTALAEALAIAINHKDDSLRRQALTSAAYVNYLHTFWRESLRYSEEAIVLSGDANDPYAEVMARYVAPLSLVTMGSYQSADFHAEAILTSAEKARDSFSLTSACWVNEIIARLTGDWEKARRFIQRGAKIASRDPRLLFSGGMLEFNVGNFRQGREYLDVLFDLLNLAPAGPTTASSNPVAVAGMAAYLTGEEDGRIGLAEAAARNVISAPNAAGTVSQIARIGLSILAVLRKDVKAAGEQYAALKPYKGTFIAYCLSADRLLGLLATTAGHFDEAAAHFEEAQEFCQKAGYIPELGWVHYEYAVCLLERNHPGDRDKALSLADESQEICDQYGLSPLARKVDALRAKAGLSEERRVVYPDGLTEREIDVLKLLAKGRRNRDIASELFISEHTVVRHVSNILAKTDSTNRSEAGLYARTHNLAD
jgi:DNA-binding CsgD family transcriptional regulator